MIKQPQLPIIDVSHLIPQKTPFVMVDTLLDFSENKVVSSFQIKADNLFVNNNRFLESGLIENMAQTVALHTGYDFFIKNEDPPDRKSTRLNSSHVRISYAVFCLKKKKTKKIII